MSRLEQIQHLNRLLLEELPEYRAQAAQFPPDEAAQRRLLRSLMNVRPPLPLKPDFLSMQNALLSAEREGALGIFEGFRPASPHRGGAI